MDCVKVGGVIANLRKEKRLKQRELAEKLNISEKTISKWERGLGCPDVSLLSELAILLGTKVENILDGNIDLNEKNTGNMKNVVFYICPECGNIVTSLAEMAIYCCGRKIESVKPVKTAAQNALKIENVENELFVSSDIEMTKSRYVSFAAYLTSDKLTLVKFYPEWNLQARFFNLGHGKLVWGTNCGEVFYQLV